MYDDCELYVVPVMRVLCYLVSVISYQLSVIQRTVKAVTGILYVPGTSTVYRYEYPVLDIRQKDGLALAVVFGSPVSHR